MTFDSLNTTGGHIFVCLVISCMGAVMMCVGHAEPSLFGIGIGLLQTGIGVAFRCMGMPNVNPPGLPPTQPQQPHVEQPAPHAPINVTARG